jgi:cytochrome oxidase Cu insertion factor (SCO1/SenC/PrrC family)
VNQLKVQLAAILVCVATLPVFARGVREQPVTGLIGTVLERPSPAADFTLTDQHGAAFRMADTKGRVVVLTFIYTHCADACPYISLKVKNAISLLGRDTDKAAFVAVTTDPQRDIPKVNLAYSKALGLDDAWSFVTGSLESVKAVWANYGIGVEIDSDTRHEAPPLDDTKGSGAAAETDVVTRGLSTTDLTLAGKIINQFGGGYDVAHSVPFWIIDKSGRVRVSLDSNATPSEIVADVRVLMKGS